MEAVPDSGCSSISSSGKEIESPSVRSRNSQLSEDEPFSPTGGKSFASGSCNSSSQDSLEPLEQGSICPAQVLIQQFEIEDSSSSPSKRNNRLRYIFRAGREKDTNRSKKYSWPQLNCGELGGCPTTKPNNLVDPLSHARNVLDEENVIQNRTYRSGNSTDGSHVIVARVSSREDPGPFPLRTRINGLGHHKSASFPSLGSVPCLKYKLLREGQVQVCRVQHSRNVFSKIASSKFMRRWETHQLTLERDEIVSKIPYGIMEIPLRYSSVEDILMMPTWDSSEKYLLQITVSDGFYLLQTNHAYCRNQWFYSVQWKRNMYRFRKVFEKLDRTDVLLKELKAMVDQVQGTTLQDDSIVKEPLRLCAHVLQQLYDGRMSKSLLEPVICHIEPLLENYPPNHELCSLFSRYCVENPRSSIVADILAKVAHQVLKRNMDFGKYPSMRTFIQDFVNALNATNRGLMEVRYFVEMAHGPASVCPHPRILPNLVSVCLAAMRSIADELQAVESADCTQADNEIGRRLECFASIFETICEYEDWRLPLSSMLQPVPFQERVLAHPAFVKYFESVMRLISMDARCDVHYTVMPLREGRDGWFHLFCPGASSCNDEGDVYALMLKTLLHCCCKRKRFLRSLNSMLGPLQLLALRENEAAMEALCMMLEFEVVEGEDMKIQMTTTLQSTTAGKKHYVQLCDRQIALRELQQKGGPRKLTLPSKSTDADLAVLLSGGSFGNLEWLSLAFTNITSASADFLIKLPSLKYLNLWSTQFGDTGIQIISEHLNRLQVLNLCETPVTDKGLIALTGLKNLRKLNLNSTQLSARTFQELRDKLPALQEVDVRYTDAWCADI